MAATALEIPSLHPRLLRFFAKFPPQTYSAYATGQVIPTTKQRAALPELKPLSAKSVPRASSLPNATASESEEVIEGQASEPPLVAADAVESITAKKDELAFNPFLPRKNHTTGKWWPPVYGLRKQADLFKIARQYGVEELLPPSIKSSEYKQRRALERGLAVRGTGEGQSVKGHKWERQIGVTMEKRKKAMEEMPEMIRLWKQRGHGRGWKKFPK